MRWLLCLTVAATVISSQAMAAQNTHGFDGFGGVYKHLERETKSVYTLSIDGEKATLKGPGLSPEQTRGLTVELSPSGKTAHIKDASGKQIAIFAADQDDYTYGAIGDGRFAKGYGITEGYWVKELTVGATDTWSDNGVPKLGRYEPIGFNVNGSRMNLGKIDPALFTHGSFLNMTADSAPDRKMAFGFTRRIENGKLILTQRYVDTDWTERVGVTVTFDLSDPMKLTCLDCDKVDKRFPKVWVYAGPFPKQ
jgi:hypothetical protein